MASTNSTSKSRPAPARSHGDEDEGGTSTTSLSSSSSSDDAAVTSLRPPLLTCPGPLNFDGVPWTEAQVKYIDSLNMSFNDVMPAQVHRWMTSLLLTRPVRVPKHDLRSGFLVADILMNHHLHKRSQLRLVDGLSVDIMQRNWQIIKKFTCQHTSIPLDDNLTDGVMHMKPGAAVRLLCFLYEYFTGMEILGLPDAQKHGRQADGWSDAIYQSKLPSYARSTATQSLKNNMCVSEVIADGDIIRTQKKAKDILGDFARRRREERILETSRHTTLPKIDRYPLPKRGIEPARRRIHVFDSIVNDETCAAAAANQTASRPVMIKKTKNAASLMNVEFAKLIPRIPKSVAQGYKPPCVVYKVADRFPERGFYSQAGRLGNTNAATAVMGVKPMRKEVLFAEVGAPLATDTDPALLKTSRVDYVYVDPRPRPEQGDHAGHVVSRAPAAAAAPQHTVGNVNVSRTLHDNDYLQALQLEAVTRQAAGYPDMVAVQPAEVRLHIYDMQDPPQHILRTLHPDSNQLIGRAESARRRQEMRGFRPQMKKFALFKPDTYVAPVGGRVADSAGDQATSSSSAGDSQTPLAWQPQLHDDEYNEVLDLTSLCSEDNVIDDDGDNDAYLENDNLVRLLADMDDDALEQANAFGTCSGDEDQNGNDDIDDIMSSSDDSDDNDGDDEGRKSTSVLTLRASRASSRAGRHDLLDLLARDGAGDIWLDRKQYLLFEMYGRRTLYPSQPGSGLRRASERVVAYALNDDDDDAASTSDGFPGVGRIQKGQSIDPAHLVSQTSIAAAAAAQGGALRRKVSDANLVSHPSIGSDTTLRQESLRGISIPGQPGDPVTTTDSKSASPQQQAAIARRNSTVRPGAMSPAATKPLRDGSGQPIITVLEEVKTPDEQAAIAAAAGGKLISPPGPGRPGAQSNAQLQPTSPAAHQVSMTTQPSMLATQPSVGDVPLQSSLGNQEDRQPTNPTVSAGDTRPPSAAVGTSTYEATPPEHGFFVVQHASTLATDPAKMSLDDAVTDVTFHSHNRKVAPWRQGVPPARVRHDVTGAAVSEAVVSSSSSSSSSSLLNLPDELVHAIDVAREPGHAVTGDKSCDAPVIGVAKRSNRLESLLRIQEHYLRVYEADCGRLNRQCTHPIGALSRFSETEVKDQQQIQHAIAHDLQQIEHFKSGILRELDLDLEVPHSEVPDSEVPGTASADNTTELAATSTEESPVSLAELESRSSDDTVYSYPGVDDVDDYEYARQTTQRHAREFGAVSDLYDDADDESSGMSRILGYDVTGRGASEGSGRLRLLHDPAWPAGLDVAMEMAGAQPAESGFYGCGLYDNEEEEEEGGVATDNREYDVGLARQDFPPGNYFFAAGHRDEEQRSRQDSR